MLHYTFPSSGGRKVLGCDRNFLESSIHPDRIMDEHDLIYMISGEWEIFQDEIAYTIKAGDFLLLFAGLHHYGIKQSSPDVSTYYIHFSKLASDCAVPDKNVTADKSVYSFPATMALPAGGALPSLMERVIACYWSRDIYAQNRASAYLELVLCELSAVYAGGTALAGASELVERLIMSIRLNPERFYSVGELATMINVSPKTLYNYFIREKGMPPHEYQLTCKLDAAESEMFRKPDITLRELASRYGFCDEYHFAKCYKAKFGHPPKRPR